MNWSIAQTRPDKYRSSTRALDKRRRRTAQTTQLDLRDVPNRSVRGLPAKFFRVGRPRFSIPQNYTPPFSSARTRKSGQATRTTGPTLRTKIETEAQRRPPLGTGAMSRGRRQHRFLPPRRRRISRGRRRDLPREEHGAGAGDRGPTERANHRWAGCSSK